MNVVVIGASGGMGKELCLRLAQKGINLALCSNDKNELNQLVSELSAYSIKLCHMTVDITNEEQVKLFFSEIQNKFEHADALFNLAGLSIPAEISNMTVEDFDTTMNVNLKGTFLCSKYFIPLVDSEEGARIINIGSMAALRPNGNAPMYCTAKSAVNMFTKGLAIQLKSKNIQVTVLNPGGTDTPFWGDRPVAKEKLMRASDVVDVMEFVLGMNKRVVFHQIDFESFLNV